MGNIDDFITHPDESPSRAITPDSMSNILAAELVEAIDNGDWELSDWHAQFIESNLGRTSFSVKQKAVIYDLARKFNLL
jgi:hypothetical protein